MLTLIALLGVATSVQQSIAGVPWALLAQLDAAAGKSALITGRVTGLECKLGSLVIHGHAGETYWFPFIWWPEEIRTSGSAADRADMDLWLTIRATIRMNPAWRADGKYPPTPNELRTALSGKTPKRYYFSDFEIVRMETKARKADGSPAVLSRSPIVLDSAP